MPENSPFSPSLQRKHFAASGTFAFYSIQFCNRDTGIGFNKGFKVLIRAALPVAIFKLGKNFLFTSVLILDLLWKVDISDVKHTAVDVVVECLFRDLYCPAAF